MRNRFVGSILAVAALAVLPTNLAQPAPQSGTAKATPDLSGIWQQTGRAARRFSMEDAPLQPWALEIYKRNRAGVTDPFEQGLDELDPSYNCNPYGFPRVMILRQFQLIQLPNMVILLFEIDHTVRWIYTDGRAHPDGYPDTWTGHSIGKWDGDTLVVDTVDFNKDSWLDRIGTPPRSSAANVEQIR